jgi:hypothetical protein
MGGLDMQRDLASEVSSIYGNIKDLPPNNLGVWEREVLKDCRDKLNEILGEANGSRN